jgi:hypothetical protein
MGEVRPLQKACTCVYYEIALGCCQEILPPPPPPQPSHKFRRASRHIHQIIAAFGLKYSTGPRFLLQPSLSELGRIHKSIPGNVLINVYIYL